MPTNFHHWFVFYSMQTDWYSVGYWSSQACDHTWNWKKNRSFLPLIFANKGLEVTTNMINLLELKDFRIDYLWIKLPGCSCYNYPLKEIPAAHVTVEDLNIIDNFINKNIHEILAKGSKYREPQSIYNNVLIRNTTYELCGGLYKKMDKTRKWRLIPFQMWGQWFTFE